MHSIKEKADVDNISLEIAEEIETLCDLFTRHEVLMREHDVSEKLKNLLLTASKIRDQQSASCEDLRNANTKLMQLLGNIILLEKVAPEKKHDDLKNCIYALDPKITNLLLAKFPKAEMTLPCLLFCSSMLVLLK
ncbi:MAG: hypothetical protein PHU71_04255 [Candidatus Gracilibacteria bacterium]|nr:hypothetical protein [Candidatus Gracilibacteria bacterium]